MTTTQRDTDYYIDTARRLADLVAANADAVNEQRQIPAHVANANAPTQSAPSINYEYEP